MIRVEQERAAFDDPTLGDDLKVLVEPANAGRSNATAVVDNPEPA
jgi:hypothetical protein